MKLEAAKSWKDALDRIKKAEKHLVAGEFELAITEAKNAALSGQFAIMFLLRGRGDDRKAAEVCLDREFFEDWEKTCSRPQDCISKVKKLLRRFSNLSPPENKLLFE
jgi:hypothetical protein